MRFPEQPLACTERPWIWDSTHPRNHMTARDLCDKCPIRDACLEWTETDRDLGGTPTGTRGGVLFVEKPPRTRTGERGDCMRCKRSRVIRAYGLCRACHNATPSGEEKAA